MPKPPIVVPPDKDWSGTVELGLNGRTGNSDRLDWRFLTEANRKTKTDRLKLYFKSFFAEEDGNQTEEKYLAGGAYELDVSPRDYAFLRLDAEHDKPRNIDLRSTVTAGLGHFFIKKSDHELKGRAGIGYQYESIDAGDDHQDVILDLGYDYRLDIRSYFRLKHDLTVFAPFNRIDAYRAVINTAGEVPIFPGEAWKLTLGMRNEYDNMPPDDVQEFDTWFYLTLGYSWD
jgi:putative salt-induced outer membrane protein